MRRYTLTFMEQRVGAARLSPIDGGGGMASFTSIDDESALAYINEQLMERVKSCVRGEMSSQRMLADASAPGGMRFVDDSHTNPHFQDSYVRYNSRKKAAELDFDSTRTVLIAGPISGI